MTRNPTRSTTSARAGDAAPPSFDALRNGRRTTSTPVKENDAAGVVQDLGLFENDDGSPVRLRRNGRQPKAVGLYFSVKSGLHLPYESKLELHDLWHAEVCTDVVRSWPQPFTLRFMLDGELRRYTPDRRDLRADGATQIIEIKDDGGGGEEPHDAIRGLLADRKMGFQVRRRAEIEAEPRFTAVEIIQRNRRARVLAPDLFSVQRLLASGALSLSEVLGVLAPGPAGFAIACTMMARRLIAIDLSRGLVGAASVKLVSRC